MTIKSKIALVFMLMTATILLLLSASVYFFSKQHAHSNFFTRLKVRASLASESHFHIDEQNSIIVREIRQRHLQRLPREEDFFFPNGDSLQLQFEKALPDVSVNYLNRILDEGFAEMNDGFLHYSGLKYQVGERDFIVIARAFDEEAAAYLKFLRNLLLFGFLSSSALVFVLGRIFAYRIMLPVNRIIAHVHTITGSNLNERVAVGGRDDELDEIARTFNAMLDRLETTFELQANFISNASHELRTPLTAILGEADVILQIPREREDYIGSIHRMHDEAKKLEEVTTSLLRLSQISYEGKKQKIEPVLIDELLMSIKINLGKRMPDNHVEILVQPVEDNPEVFTLVCSGVWMELALTNIIQNSIKYSDNREVLVTLSASAGDFFIQISDFGIGIPEDDLEHIYEPFFRGSNTANYTGYGIGLPLAERIIRLHGGKMKISSRPNEGTKVSIQFPQHRRLKAD